MLRSPLVAVLCLGLLALPVHAQGELELDFIEAATTRTLLERQLLTSYTIETGEEPGQVLGQAALVAFGVTESLVGTASFGLGGAAASPLGYAGYTLGFLYAAPFEIAGLTTAASMLYTGGIERALSGGLVLSFDRPAPVLIGDGIERFGVAVNLTLEHQFSNTGVVQPIYAVGAAYPVLSRPGAKDKSSLGARALQRDEPALLKLTLEAEGEIGPGGGHYAIPGVFLAPGESLQVGAGVGLRLAGGGNPYFAKALLLYLF